MGLRAATAICLLFATCVTITSVVSEPKKSRPMGATAVFSLRLPTERAESLKRLARRQDRSTADLAARLVEEGLRRTEFAMIDFRDTPTGREAYVQGTRIPVWRVATLVRGCKGEVGKAAEHLCWPE